MTHEQFTKLEDFIQAKIDNELERAFGRDPLQETLRENACRKELREAFGLPAY